MPIICMCVLVLRAMMMMTTTGDVFVGSLNAFMATFAIAIVIVLHDFVESSLAYNNNR